MKMNKQKRKTIYKGDLRQYVKLMNTLYGPSCKFTVSDFSKNRNY